VHRFVQQQPAAGTLLLRAGRCRVSTLQVVAEHQRHVDVAGPEHAHGFRRLGLGQQQVDTRAFRLHPRGGGRHNGGQRGRERRQPHPALAHPDMGG
jgi:hypothetical protein